MGGKNIGIQEQRSQSASVVCGKRNKTQHTERYWLERLDELSCGKDVSFAEIVIGGEEKC